MGRVFKIIFNTILILIIILLSIYCVLRFTNKVRIYNVETGSMEDKIHTGDYILLVKKSNYFVGDVVTYKVNGYFITHRIVKIDNDLVITKGDANNTPDEEINVNQIEGKVIYCGGVLNFIINYKFVIIAFLVGLYLLSCYFGDDSIEKTINDDLLLEDNSNDKDVIVETESQDENENEIINEENDEKIEIIEDISETEKEEHKNEEVVETIEEDRDNKIEKTNEEVVEKPKRTRKPKKEKIEDNTVQKEKTEEIKEVKKTKKTKKETKTKKTNKK